MARRPAEHWDARMNMSESSLSAETNLQDIDFQSCRFFLCPKKCTKNAPKSRPGLDMFAAESRYTFATDIVFYSSTKEIDAYINRMLKQYCKKNKQAYYEMIMSVLCMLEIYNYFQDEEMSMFFRNWQYKLQYSEEFYKPYITESEMSDYWRLY